MSKRDALPPAEQLVWEHARAAAKRGAARASLGDASGARERYADARRCLAALLARPPRLKGFLKN